MPSSVETPVVTVAHAAVPGREGSWNVTVRAGRVAELAAARTAATRLVLPAFAEPHGHADRAFLRPPRPATSLTDAIALNRQLRRQQSENAIAARAERFLRRALAHGAVRVRTHVDVDPEIGLRAVRGVNHARQRLRERMDVEVVAFAGASADPADPATRALLEQAIEEGVDLLGGVPNLYADPATSSQALVDLAQPAGLGIDVHVDETTQGTSPGLHRVLDAAAQVGMRAPLGLSHCSSLASLPADELRAAVERIVEAGASVHIQPATNLYLQDRSAASTPRLRGVGVARELLAAGVAVRFGGDNVADAFYPYGDADPLEAAWLAVLAAHVDEADALAGVCDGRRTLAEGDVADLVIVGAHNLTDALARRPGGRAVLRAGRHVAGPDPCRVLAEQ